MKKNWVLPTLQTLFCALFFALTPLSISAQNALGCNGTRYSADIFTDTTMTIVQYGLNYVGIQPQQLTMDIVQPKNDTLKLRPLIIWAYGGSFIFGAKEDMRPFCQLYSKKGYVTASINYRLYPLLTGGTPDSVKITHTIVQAAQDMKASIRYFRKSARLDGNPYRIDTNNIIVGGVSAGAITAMLTAQMDSLDPIPTWIRTILAEEGGIEGNSGSPGYSTAVKGAVNMSGALYRKEWLDKDDVPFVSYHGTADATVPYGYGVSPFGFYGDGSGAIHPRAVQLGVQSVLLTVPDGGHTNIYPSASNPNPPTWNTWVTMMTGFMQRLVCGTKPLPTEDVDNHQVNIYPNPANDDMMVELDKNTEGTQFDLSVFDALGRQVFSMKNQTNNQLVLHKKDIGTGLFFVQMNFEDHTKPVLRKIIFE